MLSEKLSEKLSKKIVKKLSHVAPGKNVPTKNQSYLKKVRTVVAKSGLDSPAFISGLAWLI
jgi:hypothetical protein